MVPIGMLGSQSSKFLFVARSFSKVLSISLLFFAACVSPHPADEFCETGEMDPQLCAQLAELDRPADVKASAALPKIQLDRSPFDTAVLYTKLGVEHIIPMGLDHLAFVLALVLATMSLRPLILQISLFTVAHSVTLALGVVGVFTLNGVWVEVAIAASIVFVALENCFFKLQKYRRMGLIFFFGLLHGLGFAGALSELGVPTDHFVSALLGFNVGVEIGQVGFALLVYLLLSRFLNRDWYKKAIVLPGSVFIALVGIYWLVERIFS